MLLATQLLLLALVDGASWPYSVQPFWLSALSRNLTTEDVTYLSKFPLVVINHKQGGTGDRAEGRQLWALSLVKAANASTSTFFYINSQIDFPELKMHDRFVAANGSWWLRNETGGFVMHNDDHIFDFSTEEARDAWLSTAKVP